MIAYSGIAIGWFGIRYVLIPGIIGYIFILIFEPKAKHKYACEWLAENKPLTHR